MVHQLRTVSDNSGVNTVIVDPFTNKNDKTKPKNDQVSR